MLSHLFSYVVPDVCCLCIIVQILNKYDVLIYQMSGTYMNMYSGSIPRYLHNHVPQGHTSLGEEHR